MDVQRIAERIDSPISSVGNSELTLGDRSRFLAVNLIRVQKTHVKMCCYKNDIVSEQGLLATSVS